MSLITIALQPWPNRDTDQSDSNCRNTWRFGWINKREHDPSEIFTTLGFKLVFGSLYYSFDNKIKQKTGFNCS